MIRFALKCEENHQFESWFKSGESFEQLKASALVTCPDCGSADVEKAIMAPQVVPGRAAATQPVPMHALTAPSSPAEKAMIELKRKVQENSEYVGNEFVREARAIHDGDAPERSIYGEASAEDARRLVEDGVPVAPLPFLPVRKAN